MGETGSSASCSTWALRRQGVQPPPLTPGSPPLESFLMGDRHARPVGECCGMVIALLAVLGVDLVMIVVLLGVVLTRRRWVGHQPDAFKGAIRVVEGEVSGLGGKWKRGYSRWVRDVLVWAKAPALVRNELVAVDGLAGAVRAAEAGEVKRLGSQPVIVPLAAEGGVRARSGRHSQDLAGSPAVRRASVEHMIKPVQLGARCHVVRPTG
jgi:hypothetical protein